MKTYTVIGGRPYRGHKPGETFKADLGQREERRAVERGSIAVASAPPVAGAPAETGDARLKELLALTRPKLDERAGELDLDPEGFANKTDLAEAIVTAIDEAGDDKTPDASGNDE